MPRKLLVIKRKGKLKTKSRSVIQLLHTTRSGKQLINEFPIRSLDAILIIGRDVYIESSVLSVLASMNVPVAIIAKDSVSISINPTVVVTPHYRMLQYRLEKENALEIALEYIKAKIRGMQNILKYHRTKTPSVSPPPSRNSNSNISEKEIRIWESVSSQALWNELVKLIKPDFLEVLRYEYGFSGRKPRHPDPFNKTLSVMYAVLYSLATKALIAAGLDPTFGFLHKTRYSTPLTFDYTEMFKPMAIEATITLINKEGLPKLDENGDLTREWVNNTIRYLYDYLILKHKDTGRTLYQQIHLKAFCLAKYLEGRCRKDRLTVTWDRALYRKRTYPKMKKNNKS